MARTIVNDIAEDIDNGETREQLREALAIYADFLWDSYQSSQDSLMGKTLVALEKLISERRTETQRLSVEKPLRSFAVAFDLASKGQIDAAIDEVHQVVDIMMRAGAIEDLNVVFSKLLLEDVQPDLALAFLTATLPVRSQIPNRKAFFDATHKKVGSEVLKGLA